MALGCVLVKIAVYICSNISSTKNKEKFLSSVSFSINRNCYRHTYVNLYYLLFQLEF